MMALMDKLDATLAHSLVMAQVLSELAAPAPSTKGMTPAERAQRLHAEMERRAARAKYALQWRGPADE